MAKQSAGIVVYRQGKQLEVLLVHPGGPFFAKKDKGVWSIPKGELANGEEGLAAAQREFQEEIGRAAPKGKYVSLGSAKQKGGKTVHAWAVEGDLDAAAIQSNVFAMEWPPRSGKQQEFTEIDKAGWFAIATALQKITPGQDELLQRLAEALHITPPSPTEQTSLF